MAAGNYPHKLTWLVRTTETNTDNGQPEETFTASGYLWGRIEETNGRKQKDFGVEQPGADALIYLRNYPNISALDRLLSLQWGDTWKIDHVFRGDNELILQVYKLDNPTVLDQGVYA